MTYSEFNERKPKGACFIIIDSIIDLEGNSISFITGSTLCFQGGGFINTSNTASTLNIKNTKIEGSYDDIIHSSNTGVINITNIQVGTYRYDPTALKPVWWNGTAWADATGTPV